MEMLRTYPCCGAVSQPFYSIWSRCDETKTIKPAINKAFVALSEDKLTDYNGSYSLFMRCAAPFKHKTMSALVIVETPNKHYSTLLNLRLNSQ